MILSVPMADQPFSFLKCYFIAKLSKYWKGWFKLRVKILPRHQFVIYPLSKSWKLTITTNNGSKWSFSFPFRFLYQIFPGTTLQCQRLLFKAAKTGELDTVQKLVSKFLSFTSHARVGGYFSNDFFSVLASKMEVQNIAISNKKWLSQDGKI